MSLNTILATTPLTSTGYHLKATGTTIGNSLIWDNGTNVGIGNTNTSYTLDVSGTGRFTGNLQLGSSSSTLATSEAALLFGSLNYLNIGAIGNDVFFNNNAYYNGSIWKYVNTNYAASYYQSNGTHNFRYAASGTAGNTITWTNAMTITSAGNVGIGGTPTTKFELFGSSGNFQIASSGAEVFFTRNDNNDILANGGSSAGIRFGGQQQLRFATGTSLSTRLTIDVSGNMVINNVAAQLQWEGGNYWTWRTVTSGTEFWLYRGDTGATPFIVTTGNVVRLSSLAGSGSRTVTADASGNLSASSDSSLKQEDASHKIEGLAEILQLKPRAYKWLSDIEIRGEEATTEIGFFANEVNAIIPSAAPKGNDDLYGFYDRAVIAALVKAVQEQNQTIQNLQEQINILAK